MSIWDVVAGGGITLAGTTVTQLVVIAVARGQRHETRRLAAAEYNRRALDELQQVAKAYRRALVQHNHELGREGSATNQTEDDLQSCRMDYQALLHRVDVSVTTQFEQWERVALDWSQLEESAAREASTWTAAMKVCGHRVRDTLT